MDRLRSIVLSIILLKYAFAEINDPITISTPSGKVKGFIMESPAGREVAAFLGIPYGQPPVGNLRFKPPLKAKPWEGVLDGTKMGSPCKQIILKSDEDCLNLNVYTPQTNKSFDELYPVIASIFGGAFAVGEAIPPMSQPLLDKNLVLVSMNYRLNVFGYATTLDEILPGNYGQLDQILALKWIQENIAYFGGDAKSVTLYGYSSGSAAVMANVVSPLSNGLIHGAIMASGCTLCKQAGCYTTEEFTRHVAKNIDSSTNSSQSIKDVLGNVSAGDTVLWDGLPIFGFMYNVDNTSGYMPLSPDLMPYEPNVAKIPVIIGTLPNDGAMFGRLAYQFSKNTSDLITSLRGVVDLAQSFYSGDVEKLLKLITTEYNIQNAENMTPNEILQYFTDMATDLLVSCCDISIEILAKAGFPVYAYKFNHVSKLTTSGSGTSLGHAADIQFIISLSKKEKYIPMTGSDLKTSRNIMDFWANFAKYGNPNPVNSTPGESDAVWKQWTVNSPAHVLLNESPSMEDGYFSNHTQFWQNHPIC